MTANDERGDIERLARHMFENRTRELDASPDDDNEWDILPWRDEWIEGAEIAMEGVRALGFTKPRMVSACESGSDDCGDVVWIDADGAGMCARCLTESFNEYRAASSSRLSQASGLIHEQTCRDNQHDGPESDWPCVWLAAEVARCLGMEVTV